MPKFEQIEIVAADADDAWLGGELEDAPLGGGGVVCVVWDACEIWRERGAPSGVEVAEDIQKLGLSAQRIERGGKGGIDGGDVGGEVGGDHGGRAGGRWLRSRSRRGKDGGSRRGRRRGRRHGRRSRAVFLSGTDCVELPHEHVAIVPAAAAASAAAAAAAAARPARNYFEQIRVVSPS